VELRVAFAGFRHMHLREAYRMVRERSDLAVSAVSEEDPEVRELIESRAGIRVTHHSNEALLESADFDILVVGEVFARRGALILRALSSGRHVLSDKPICTTIAELEAIEDAAERAGLAVGAMLELRDSGVFRSLRSLVSGGALGVVHAAAFSGQHPLLLDSRPRWYFQPGAHGGTLNDLAVHALDLMPWLTGRRFTRLLAARCWNAGLAEQPDFRNAAQLMLEMEGGLGVIGDVSYLSPDGFGYRLPTYWRFTLWGEEGAAEGGLNSAGLALYRRRRSEPELVAPEPNRPGGYLDRLLESTADEALRRKGNHELFTATRVALLAQRGADQGMTDLQIPFRPPS
jgi:predicted dehydrogenase